MPRWVIGDLLSGRRIQTLPALSGQWSEVLNGTGDISATVTLKDPVVRRLGVANSAAVGKAFLAVIEDDVVLQAGPIWQHRYDGDTQKLTLTGAGMWSYFDHRVLLPVLAGRNPTDSTTDTRFTAVSTDPDDPWPTDTRKSLQGIARALVVQARSWTNGNVPVILPAEIAGTAERYYKGADLGMVGERLTQLTQVEGGPDILFQPRLTTDRMGVEWVMRIGTPDQPLLFSPQDVVFQQGVSASSVSGLSVVVDGTRLAAQAFASGGRTDDVTLISVSNRSELPTAGYPLLEVVDSSHSTVSIPATLQGYADEITLAGRTPIRSVAFSHQLSQRPYVGSFSVGDFARVTFKGDPYVEDGQYRLRILSRSGDAEGKRLALTFQDEVI